MSRYNYPPPGEPPTPVMPLYSAPYESRMSGLAITSLVLGILICIPALTGLASIGFGIGGIAVTRNPAVRGRGMAIAGLILGILNIFFWAGAGGFWWETVRPIRAASHQFVYDMAAGNTAAVTAECTNPIGPTQITNAQAWFKQKPPVAGTSITYSNVQDNMGMNTGSVVMVIHFNDGSSSVAQINLIELTAGWKVTNFQFH
jgi:uncharacterized protein DUF4190